MTILNAGLLGSLSGKVGNVVVVNRRGTTYLRSLPTYKKSSWTVKQAKVRNRFGKVNQFCQLYKEQVIVPIWNLNLGRASGYHQFLAANIKAFDSDGTIKDISMLQFSIGSLPPPHKVSAQLNHEGVFVTWVNDQDLKRTRMTDELWYMAVVGDKVSGPYRSGLTRDKQEGLISLNDGSTIALFIFFASSDRNSFSSDRFVVI